MKNLILLFALCLGIQALPQKVSAEKLRIHFATTMASFTEAVAPNYAKGLAYERFEASLGTKPTAEGRLVLRKAFGYLQSGTSREEIVKKDSGLEIAKAAVLLDKISEEALFGVPDIPKLTPNRCKWYQLRCHYNAISNLILDIVDAAFVLIADQPLINRE